MTKQEIVDYVMTSPANTNRTILEQMLDELVKPAPAAPATQKLKN